MVGLQTAVVNSCVIELRPHQFDSIYTDLDQNEKPEQLFDPNVILWQHFVYKRVTISLKHAPQLNNWRVKPVLLMVYVAQYKNVREAKDKERWYPRFLS